MNADFRGGSTFDLGEALQGNTAMQWGECDGPI